MGLGEAKNIVKREEAGPAESQTPSVLADLLNTMHVLLGVLDISLPFYYVFCGWREATIMVKHEDIESPRLKTSIITCDYSLLEPISE